MLPSGRKEIVQGELLDTQAVEHQAVGWGLEGWRDQHSKIPQTVRLEQ